MEQETSAGIVLYRRTKEGPKFLLLYNGGRYWNFPKGKLAKGEKSFKAALREVQEETGIKPRDLHFAEWFRIRDKFTFTRNRKEVEKEVVYYLAETKNPRVQLKIPPPSHKGERHEGYGWFLLKDALPLLIHKNLRKNLKKAHDLVVSKKSVQKDKGNSPR